MPNMSSKSTDSNALVVFRNSDSAVEDGWPSESLELRAEGGVQLTWDTLREIETGRVLGVYKGFNGGWSPVDHAGNYSDVEIVVGHSLEDAILATPDD